MFMLMSTNNMPESSVATTLLDSASANTNTNTLMLK